MSHLQYDLPVLVNIPLVPIDHAECHGVIGSLGHLLGDLHRPLQVRCDHTYLLGRSVEVSYQQLVHADALDWLDEEGVYALSVA